MRLLETIQLIHQVRSKIIFSDEELESPQITGKTPNLKGEATKWLKERISINRILYPGKTDLFYPFTLVGFSDEPDVFVYVTNTGIKFGYEGISWHGHIPEPSFTTLNTLSWEKLDSLSESEKETLAIDTFLKTINTRQRQYKTCQFCCEKSPPELRINSRTCHICATKHFHVVF